MSRSLGASLPEEVSELLDGHDLTPWSPPRRAVDAGRTMERLEALIGPLEVEARATGIK